MLEGQGQDPSSRRKAQGAIYEDEVKVNHTYQLCNIPELVSSSDNKFIENSQLNPSFASALLMVCASIKS
jgi:hypothetical protein